MSNDMDMGVKTEQSADTLQPVTIRFTPEAWQALRDVARQEGVSVAEIARLAITGKLGDYFGTVILPNGKYFPYQAVGIKEELELSEKRAGQSNNCTFSPINLSMACLLVCVVLSMTESIFLQKREKSS